MKYLLAIIDMQQGFFKKEKLANDKNILVKNINSLSSFCRDKGVPVVWVRQVYKADLSDSPLGNRDLNQKEVVEGTADADLLADLLVGNTDLEIIKKRYSAFFKTDFEKILQEKNIEGLIICGINTHACIRTTVVDAYMRDYRVIVAKDCVGSYDQEHHEITLKYFEPKIAKVLSNEEIYKLLG